MSTLRKVSTAILVTGSVTVAVLAVSKEDKTSQQKVEQDLKEELSDLLVTARSQGKEVKLDIPVDNVSRTERSLYKHEFFMTTRESAEANKILSLSLCEPLGEVDRQLFNECLADQKESAWIAYCDERGSEIGNFVIIRLNGYQFERLRKYNRDVITLHSGKPKVFNYCPDKEVVEDIKVEERIK